ncbi:hypothetical protein [Streptomyces sp. NPDC059142]|uniref:hypothetical protein n=1 Tax=Streptomyces sp. NPDC059142 TaxID=3346739 RepID=UPI0036B6216F
MSDAPSGREPYGDEPSAYETSGEGPSREGPYEKAAFGTGSPRPGQEPSEEALLEAVLAYGGGNRRTRHPHRELVEGVRKIERHQLLRARTVRCVETREEEDAEHHGPLDLSGRPRYRDELRDHVLAAPKDAHERLTLELVREGSDREIICSCDNGRIACTGCEGRGSHQCPDPETALCPECLGVGSCAHCPDVPRDPPARRAGTGKPAPGGKPGPGGKPPVAPAARPVRGAEAPPRTTCARCRRKEAACASCRGRGVIACTTCGGSHVVQCEECRGSRRIEHKQCGGKGSVVRWVRGVVRRRPSATALALPRRSWPRQVRHRLDRRTADWRELTTAGGDPFSVPDGVDRIHRRSLEGHLARDTREIAREVSVRSLRLTRLKLVNQPNWVFYVLPDERGLTVTRVPSRQLLLRASGATAGALTVLVLLLVLLG